jgi:hypothetical protein
VVVVVAAQTVLPSALQQTLMRLQSLPQLQ